MRLGVGRRAYNRARLRAAEVRLRDTLWKSLAEHNHDLSLHVDAFVIVDVLRLHNPAAADINQRTGHRRRHRVRQKVIAGHELLAIDLSDGFRRVDLLAPQSNLLQEGAVIARGFESPSRQIKRDELRDRVQTARRCVASFHLVRGDEREIGTQLRGRNRINSAARRGRLDSRRLGMRWLALGQRGRQRDRQTN